MKKFKKIIVVILALAVCALVLAACGDRGNTGGNTGNSAYTAWLSNGHSGTEQDFLDWIAAGGDTTAQPAENAAYKLWLANGHNGTEADFEQWIKDGGDQTEPEKVKDDTAYKLWLASGHNGTEDDFLQWVKEDGKQLPLATDELTLKYAFDGLYGYGELHDWDNGFRTVSDLTGARFCINGNYKGKFISFYDNQDVQMELYNGKATRIVNVPGGIAYTIPSATVESDYSISKHRNQFKFDNCILTATSESSSPYANTPEGWYVTAGEWLMMYINDDTYLEKNGITRINGSKSYTFSERRPKGDEYTKEGYGIFRYDLKIENSGDTERPYYHVAVIRQNDEYVKFALLVLKAPTDKSKVMDKIVESFTRITPMGVQNNYLDAGTPLSNPLWDDATANYFDRLMNSGYVHWGAFSKSLPQESDSLKPTDKKYQDELEVMKAFRDGVEEIWDYDFDIYPTYGHLGWFGTKWSFPLEMAKELAGGDGTNGKPVLQYTYQFTIDNNMIKQTKSTPLFDIMRGVYDDQFRELAADIKEYGAPILFRLNNEMDSDWTSYCGMMTLLDTDIFSITWRRLYDIFDEEGVGNVIWIWNPNDRSCPYSSWGESLCYFPGVRYVQLLGGTIYTMNNDNTLAQPDTFKTNYTALYERDKETFSGWGVIISEFACGSGGELVYNWSKQAYEPAEAGRNRDRQAAYITNMFNELTAEDRPEWANRIKGAVWFNCDDDADYGGVWKSINRLRFYDPYDDSYDDLVSTRAAFKEGFAKQKAMMKELGVEK